MLFKLTGVHSSRCHKIFQKIEELVDNPPLYVDSGTSTALAVDLGLTGPFEKALFTNNGPTDPAISGTQQKILANPRKQAEGDIEDDPSRYARVRLHHLIPSSRRSVSIQCDVDQDVDWMKKLSRFSLRVADAGCQT